MASSRVFISGGGISRTQYSPTWSGRFKHRKDDGGFFYRLEADGAFTFTRNDYDAIMAILNPDSCDTITLEVERYCGESWTVFWTGTFTYLDIVHDADNCFFSVTPREESDYTCFLNLWKVPVNLHSLNIVAVNPYKYQEEYEITHVKGISYMSDPTLDPLIGPDPVLPPDPANWCDEYESNEAVETQPGTWYVFTAWHRMVAPGTCDGATPQPPTIDTFWTLLENNCPADCEYWRCPNDELNHVTAVMKYGRLFSDAMELMFGVCGLTVVSDFFDINPDATAPANDAYTFASTYLHDMTVHQKSDVKRPYSSAPANSSSYTVRPFDFLQDLQVIFNISWQITGTTIRIEHISFFEDGTPMDCTADPARNQLEATDDDKIKQENFFFADEACSEYFAGDPIKYDCGSEDTDVRCNLISTDVNFIQYIGNSDSITDKGFVLVCTEIVTGARYMMRDNRPLSWTELHDKLHRHKRRFVTGTLNGDPVTFISAIKTKKAPPFQHILCCDEAFNPIVETTIGIGEVEEAEYLIDEDLITISAKYQ